MSVTGGPVRLRSELAHRLDRDIAAAAAMPVRCAVLQAQRAILWLHHGHDVEARKELIRLQGAHSSIPTSSWRLGFTLRKAWQPISVPSAAAPATGCGALG